MKRVWLLIALVACGNGNKNTVDARVDSAGHPDAAIDAAVDATSFHPGMALSHTLFLQTEGVMLVLGNADATMNRSPLLNADQTLAAWRVGDAQRTTEIAGIVAQIQAALAPYHIDVVTTRPASGPYGMMIATDSSPGSLGLPGGTFAVTDNPAAGCNTIASDVGIMFPGQLGTTFTPTVANFVAQESIAMFAFGNGVPFSNLAHDCMCFSGSACGGTSMACTIGGPSTPVDSMGRCGDPEPTMDENAVFLAVFGAH